jgi:DME family drug/metabolite transporter
MSSVVEFSSPARTRTGPAFLIAAGLLWGTGGLAGAYLAVHASLHPLVVATYRLLLGGVLAVSLLWPAGGLRGLERSRAVARRLLAAGVLLAFFQAAYFASVLLTSVSIGTMTTIGSVPMFVALADCVRSRRLPNAGSVVAIVVAVLGLVLLTWSPGDVTDRTRLAAGVVLALAAGAGFAVLTFVMRTPVQGLDPLRTTAFGCLVGGLLLLPVALGLGMAVPLRGDVIAVTVYFGLFPTALAYAAYFRGLGDSPVLPAALAALLEPLTAALLGALLFGDRLGFTGWCGAALLGASLLAGYRTSRRE